MHDMARGGFSVFVTALTFGAVGFGAGAYFPPAEQAAEFRVFVDSNIAVMKEVIRSAIDKPVADKSKLAPSEAPQATPETQ
jgi:hypothetical protein